jgi:DNA polymerase-3 subunit alpha/error-prone DNA polymerase
MSKKDREHEIRDYRARFVAGARTRGVSGPQIDRVWEMIMSFSGYSFCKPHSASYARVSFQSAYLKLHHPAEFMAAVISNQGGFYSTFAYVSEARRMGLEIRPPDANHSRIRWTGRGTALRVGLLSVAGLAADTCERIVRGRDEAPYRGLGDFFDRVRPNEAEAGALIHAGALDGLGPPGSRAARLWAYRRWQQAASRKPKPRPLFGAPPEDPPAPPLPPEDPFARLRREFSVLGFLCDRHPMTLYADTLARAGAVKAVDLVRRAGRRACFGGWLITGKVVHTRSGDPMEFLTFEDETGVVETTFFPRTYHRFCHMVDRGRPYLLRGVVERDWGATTLTVDRVEALERLSPAAAPSPPAGR